MEVEYQSTTANSFAMLPREVVIYIYKALSTDSQSSLAFVLDVKDRWAALPRC